jgi:hypothetical protein
MPGRHTTTRRRSRAGPIFSAVVAVAVIVALGVYLAPRLTDEGEDGDCQGTEQIAIAAPAELSRPIDATVRTMLEKSGSGSCVSVDVSTVHPDSSLGRIASRAKPTATVWILDSSARLAELESNVRPRIEVVGKAAETPIILVASRTTSQSPPSSWRDAFASNDFYMHAPSNSKPESLFALAALAAEDPNTDLTAILTDVVERIDALNEELPRNSRLIRQSQKEFGPARLFPVTEQNYARASNNHTDWQLTPLLPLTGTVILDYPIVVRDDTDRAAVDTAEQLTEFVATPSGNSALATAGFRVPNGRILNTAAYTEPYEVFPTPAGLRELMGAWSEAQAAAS